MYKARTQNEQESPFFFFAKGSRICLILNVSNSHGFVFFQERLQIDILESQESLIFLHPCIEATWIVNRRPRASAVEQGVPASTQDITDSPVIEAIPANIFCWESKLHSYK